jgi:hypothetical protein
MEFALSPEQQAVQEKARHLAREVKGLSARLVRSANGILRLIIGRELLRG